MPPFYWLILSYLLGSFPSGYLISRWSGKEILKIGWKKTSGSNVYKNVGRWQGALTGILDVAKGYLVVYGAQKLGFSSEIQALSGVAAIVGNNWSCFLRFAGGRGIGTYIGALLVIAPKILGLSLLPFALLSLIWNAAIGTLLFLVSAFFLSFYLGQWETAGTFATLSLLPILIKRSSPIKEIPKSTKPLILLRNRLLFDNNETSSGLRIKRILKKSPKNFSDTAHSLAGPVLLPPKIGWRAAKFGMKMAKKPIELLISRSSEKVVTEVDQNLLKNMMIAAAKKIVLHQEEINKINVWPVADKDTGYNLAATLLGIEGTISQREYKNLWELTKDIKESALVNARGNSGMIYIGFLIRFLEQIKDLKAVNSYQLAFALQKGAKAARLSIINPVEGTILDVIKASAQKAYEVVRIKKEKNIIKVLDEAYLSSQKALAETKEKLEILKQNDVVDAGALGFAKIFESWIESLKDLAPAGLEEKVSVQISEPKLEEKLEYRYDLVFSFRKPGEEIDLEKLKQELTLLGDSIDIVKIEDKIKFHIHTNLPEKVKEKIKDFEVLEWRVENMIIQGKEVIRKKPLGLVVGETADLPREFLEKNKIIEIPFPVKFPNGEILEKENLFTKLKEARQTGKNLPITSAPPFQDFLSAYQRALERFEEILVITISSKLSGTYSSARIARSMIREKRRINIFDCFSAEIGEGLVVMKTQELISRGKNKNEILETLKSFCPKIKIIGCLKDFNYTVRSGRLLLPKAVATIISFFSASGIRFLFGIEKGRAKFYGIRFGKDITEILLREVEKEQKKRKIKLAVAYGENLKEALRLKQKLDRKKDTKVLFVSQVSPAVGVYTGPEVLIVGICPDLK